MGLHKFLSTIFWLPLEFISRAAATVQFIRLEKGLPHRQRFTPMIGFQKYRWSKSQIFKLCRILNMRRASISQWRGIFHWGGEHRRDECRTGQPCITFYGLKHEKRTTARKTWQLFTVELLHHILERMDPSYYIDNCFERIHGNGPYPKIIRPGPPYTRIKKTTNHIVYPVLTM